MLPTSVFRRQVAEHVQGRRRAAWKSGGFTLLELLVVLTITALAVGAVLPLAVNGLKSARERTWRQEAKVRIEGLPLEARAQGKATQWDAPALLALVPDLPDDVKFRVAAPLRYSARGVASGGEIELTRQGQEGVLLRWHVEPVTGRVRE